MSDRPITFDIYCKIFVYLRNICHLCHIFDILASGHPPPPSTSASASGSLLRPPTSGLQSPSLPQVCSSHSWWYIGYDKDYNLSDVPSRLLQLWSDVLELLCQAGPAGNGSIRPGAWLPLSAQHVQPHPLLPGGRRPLPGGCRGAWSANPLPPPVRVSHAHAQIGEAAA